MRKKLGSMIFKRSVRVHINNLHSFLVRPDLTLLLHLAGLAAPRLYISMSTFFIFTIKFTWTNSHSFTASQMTLQSVARHPCSDETLQLDICTRIALNLMRMITACQSPSLHASSSRPAHRLRLEHPYKMFITVRHSNDGK
jgi:hypothetical protein